MAFEFKNCTFTGGGIGIAAPETLDLKLIETVFDGMEIGVKVYPSTSLMEKLGLRPDTPPAVLISVLQGLQAMPAAQPEIETRAKASGLADWLAAGANLTTVAEGLHRIQIGGAIGWLLSQLSTLAT